MLAKIRPIRLYPTALLHDCIYTQSEPKSEFKAGFGELYINCTFVCN